VILSENSSVRLISAGRTPRRRISEVNSDHCNVSANRLMTKNLCKWLGSNARCSAVVPIYNQVPESAAKLLVPCHASRSSRELALASNLFACELCDRITVTLWLPVRPISLMRRNDLTRQYSSQPACARFLATGASAHIPVDFKPIPCSVGSQYADRASSAFSLELLLSLMSGDAVPFLYRSGACYLPN
jgi:hypothetical protein